MALGVALSPVGSPAASTSRPEWIKRPKLDDHGHLYRIGQATGWRTPEEGIDAAYENAKSVILREIATTAGSNDTLLAGVVLEGVEILRECVYHEISGGRYRTWVAVCYPHSERNAILKRIDTGCGLNARWAEAQAAAHHGESATAVAALTDIYDRYPEALGVSFALDDAALLLAECYERQFAISKARDIYQRILKLSPDSSPARARAQESLQRLDADPVGNAFRELFGSRKIVVLAACRIGGSASPWPKMQDIVSSFAQQHGGTIVTKTPSPSPDDILRWSTTPTLGTDPTKDWDADLVVVFAANGKVLIKPNKEMPSAEDFRFEGDIETAVLAGGEVLFAYRFAPLCGWAPISEQFCLEVLAVNSLERGWKPAYLKSGGKARL